MAQIVFFVALAIAMLVVLENSFQIKHREKHRKEAKESGN